MIYQIYLAMICDFHDISLLSFLTRRDISHYKALSPLDICDISCYNVLSHLDRCDISCYNALNHLDRCDISCYNALSTSDGRHISHLLQRCALSPLHVLIYHCTFHKWMLNWPYQTLVCVQATANSREERAQDKCY
jgi:hypothetical protein